MKKLVRRLAEDLRHAAVMLSHHHAVASTAKPAAAGLAITLFSWSQRALRARAAREKCAKVKLGNFWYDTW